jgi:hypothetical protein
MSQNQNMSQNQTVSVYINRSDFVAPSDDIRTTMKRRTFVAQWFTQPVMK